MTSNRSKLIRGKCLAPKAPLTKEQAVVLESLTPEEIAALISVRKKLAKAFPKQAWEGGIITKRTALATKRTTRSG